MSIKFVKLNGYVKGDIEKVISEIESLKQQKNHFPTNEEIIEFAKNPKTEIHKSYEWDDRVCGVLYRKVQTLRILNDCGFRKVEKDEKGNDIIVLGEKKAIPLYESVKIETGNDGDEIREYTNVLTAFQSNDKQQIKLVGQAIKKYLQIAQEKFDIYNDMMNKL